MRHVIIGASAAGIAACETIRSRDRDSPVTVISDETEGAYSRCLLPHYLSGEWQREALWFREKDFFPRFGITALLGKKAERIDVPARQVILASGEEVAYDTLLLATGGEAQLPRLPGSEAAGVMALRTLADADQMLAIFGETRRAVILGGGLIGCKTAAAIRKRGLDATILVSSGRLLSQMLDEGAGGIFRKKFLDEGIGVETGADPREILAEGGRVSGVRTGDGRVFPAEMVVVGKGVRPRIDLAREAGIAVEKGVLVDERLRTSVPGIFAAGDAAQAPALLGGEKVVNSLWPVAVEQGRIAGTNMAGGDAAYDGSLGRNAVGFFGLNVISAGKIDGRGPGETEMVQADPARGFYRKLVLRGGRVVGMILVGDVAAAGVIVSLIRRGADASALAQAFFRRSFSFGDVAAAGIAETADFPDLVSLGTVPRAGIGYIKRSDVR